MEYILSIDAGTTAFKSSLFDQNGRLLGISTKEYQLLTPTSLAVELPAETFWYALKSGIKDLTKKTKINTEDIRALGLSVQGETFLLVDKKGNPLRNAIVWLDNRAQAEAKALSSRFDRDGLSYKTTGQVKIVPTWPSSKILWIRKHEKNIFDKIYKILLLEDYLIYRMTGEFVAEGSLLCSTVYWNISTKKYWDEMLDYLQVSIDQLPDVKEPGEPVGEMRTDVAKELGLSQHTIISTGVLDQAAGAIGVGNITQGIFSENTGAALAICATLQKPIFDRKRRMPIHYHGIPNTYMAHTFTTGGMVLRWYRDQFWEEEMRIAKQKGIDAYDVMGNEIAAVPPGSDGLVMLPHLQGAMAPEVNPKAKGVFFGFTLKHTKPYFARAIMEAIACIVRRNIDVLEELHIPVNEIRVLGGGARSDIWNQIKADVTGKTILRTENEEAACLGAAILAGKAVGLYKSVKEASKNMVRIKRKFNPQKDNVRIYRDTYKKYIKLYDTLCEMFNYENPES